MLVSGTDKPGSGLISPGGAGSAGSRAGVPGYNPAGYRTDGETAAASSPAGRGERSTSLLATHFGPLHHPFYPLAWQVWAKTSLDSSTGPAAPAPTRKASGRRPVLGILLRRASSRTMLRGSSGSAVSLFSGRMSSCRLGSKRKASASAQEMKLLVRSIRFSFSGGRGGRK